LPAAAVLGSGHTAGLTSGQLATTAPSGTPASVLPLPQSSLGGGAAAAFILAPTVYTDHELAMLVNR